MKSAWVGIAIGLGIAALAQQSVNTATSSQQSGNASAKSSASGYATGGGTASGNAFSPAKPTHAILWMPGDRWEEGKRTEEQPLFREHAEYLKSFVKSGKNYMSGPWRDDPGGLTLLRVKTDEEAQAILDNDPMVKAGVLDGEIRAWIVLMDGSMMGQGIKP